ncbi:MAG: hypothetical protein RLZZ316_1365 [Bacteroidota bacterium]
MAAPVCYKLHNQNLWLSATRVLFWEEAQTLIASDLHLGKTGHFRKSGIAVPQAVYKEDLQRLVQALQHFQPKQLVVVGDFFHSHANKELDLFSKWRSNFASLEITLVKGNHDILQADWYTANQITVIEQLQQSPFRFLHDPATSTITQDYVLSGHIHPGIRVGGLGKQSVRLPCFYFGKQQGILPAFSGFTGLATIEPNNGDAVFAIVKNTIVAF